MPEEPSARITCRSPSQPLKSPDHAHALGVGRPHRERDPLHAVDGARMRAEDVPRRRWVPSLNRCRSTSPIVEAKAAIAISPSACGGSAGSANGAPAARPRPRAGGRAGGVHQLAPDAQGRQGEPPRFGAPFSRRSSVSPATRRPRSSISSLASPWSSMPSPRGRRGQSSCGISRPSGRSQVTSLAAVARDGCAAEEAAAAQHRVGGGGARSPRA